MTSPGPLLFPAILQAPGTADAPFEPSWPLADLPPGAMRRVTRGRPRCPPRAQRGGHRRHRGPLPAHVGAAQRGRAGGLRRPLPAPSRRLRPPRRRGRRPSPPPAGWTPTVRHMPPWQPEDAEAKPAPTGRQGPRAGADARATTALLPAARSDGGQRGDRPATMRTRLERHRTLVRWLPAVAWMAVIFLLSSQSGLRVSRGRGGRPADPDGGPPGHVSRSWPVCCSCAGAVLVRPHRLRAPSSPWI